MVLPLLGSSLFSSAPFRTSDWHNSPLYNECQTQSAYQYHFVKTRSRCVWSNRDMGLFSFWPISPQFAKESPQKPLKSVHPSGSHFGGLFSMLWAWFLDYLVAFLCIFCDETLFSEAFFQRFLHFHFVKTRSHRKKVAKGTGTCFDKL